MKILITGGTGFFGMILKRHLSLKGHDYVNLDRIVDPQDQISGRMVCADLRDLQAVEGAFKTHGSFDAVCHVAAELAHEADDREGVWNSNVHGTRNLAAASQRHGVKKLIFTSTNCLWGKPLNRLVTERDLPHPVEVYGKSKLAAEQVLNEFVDSFPVIIFRSPTIISSGRIGLLGILFDFILENRRLPVVGKGDKAYQFIDAEDYANAIELALKHEKSNVFHIGSDNATSLKESYRYVITQAKSGSIIYHLPEFPTLQMMKLCHYLGLSPLGPYHYSMIAEEFVFDTEHIKTHLHWKPTKTNGEILYAAYEFYVKNKQEIENTHEALSAHRKSSKQGIIKLLKWIS